MTRNLSTLRITPEILSLIAEIDVFKGALAGDQRIAPGRLASLVVTHLRPCEGKLLGYHNITASNAAA